LKDQKIAACGCAYLNITMTIIIRPARLVDADALPAIEQSAAALFRKDPSLAWLADADVPDVLHHRHAIGTAHVWVAQSADGPLIGFVSAIEIDNELHIQELSVAEGFQGQGAGRKLLLAALEHADQRQLTAVTLTTFRDVSWNEPFYQRLGFQTLTGKQINPRLAAALSNEIAYGLPAERRCAMRLQLP
jgi:GNAT superfamily N-acetyltransferase